MKFEINSREDYLREYKKSISDPGEFWSEKAECFLWKQKWNKVLEWNFNEPLIRWFIGGKLNITENCLDRQTGGIAITFKKTYFSKFPGFYFSEDRCKRDKGGHYKITGRTDDND